MDASHDPSAPLTEEQRDIAENKDIAAFGYLWIMSVFVYFLRRNSPFVKFHSKQAMVLFVISIVVWFIPYLNRPLELIRAGVHGLRIHFCRAGEKKDVPIVGPLSRGEITLRQAWKQLIDLIVRLAHAARDLAKGSSSAKRPESSQTPKEEPKPQENQVQEDSAKAPTEPGAAASAVAPETRDPQPATPPSPPSSPSL